MVSGKHKINMYMKETRYTGILEKQRGNQHTSLRISQSQHSLIVIITKREKNVLIPSKTFPYEYNLIQIDPLI